MNLKYLLTYCRTRATYSYWLVLQLLFILSLIGYAFTHYGKDSDRDIIITRIELAITAIFILEVFLRIYMTGLPFFLNIWNVIDMTNLLIIVLIFVCSYVISFNRAPLAYSDDIPLALLGARYICQAIRILFELKASREIREAAKLNFTFESGQCKDVVNSEPADKLVEMPSILVI